MTPKAVFWDMDGTLVDSEPLHEAALVAALRSVGIAPPADLHERVLGIAAWPVYEMMRDEFGLDLPFDDWIVRKYDHYLPHGRDAEAAPRRDRDLQRTAGAGRGAGRGVEFRPADRRRQSARGRPRPIPA